MNANVGMVYPVYAPVSAYTPGTSITYGTGAVAAAVVGVETQGMSLPIHVRTIQGYDLTVDGDWRRAKGTGFTLTGPVKKVYEGEIDLDSLDLGNEME